MQVQAKTSLDRHLKERGHVHLREALRYPGCSGNQGGSVELKATKPQSTLLMTTVANGVGTASVRVISAALRVVFGSAKTLKTSGVR
jgi:hypothetical protein